MDNKNFFIDTKTDGDICTLVLNGYLDAHTSSRLEVAIAECMSNNFYNIIIDFSNLNYISSAGLGVFMVYIEDIRQHGGDIAMTNMQPKIYNIFSLLGFNEIFSITNSMSEAISLFNKQQI